MVEKTIPTPISKSSYLTMTAAKTHPRTIEAVANCSWPEAKKQNGLGTTIVKQKVDARKLFLKLPRRCRKCF